MECAGQSLKLITISSAPHTCAAATDRNLWGLVRGPAGRSRAGDLYGAAMSRACKKYFVDAVLNYTYEKSVIKDISYTCGWFLDVFPLRLLASWIYEVYPDWEGDRRDIRAQIKGEDYRKLFVSAVNEYVREKHCTIKEVLLAFRLPASRNYHWKSDVRDDPLLKP